MPAIRDFNWTFESVTTDAGLTIPICNNSSGDLLIVFVMGDTGAPTWTPPTGFKQFFTRNNTTSNACFFKISGGSETDLVVGSTVTETYNGCVVAIRDVDTATPFGVTNVGNYSETNVDNYAQLGNGTIVGVGQSFAGAASILAKARFYLKKNGTPTGNAVAKLYAHSGTMGTSSVPTGAALATSDNFDVSTLTTSPILVDFVFSSVTNWFTMVAATNYVIALEYSGGDASNYVQVGYDGSTPGHAGNYSELTGAWAANNARDLAFYVQRFNFTEAANSGGGQVTASTIVTDRDDCIVMYWHSASAVSMPSFLEGPVHHLTGGDGSAESMGVGWAYQKTAGTTSAAIICNSYATGSGIKALFQVNAPKTGPTVVPAYIAEDLCNYKDPLHGVSAYDGNTAFAATADTNFGTTLGGITANDGTAAAIADVGINSFHSMAGLTNAASATAISGAELVFATGNRPNVGTKNILCHLRPSTPANTQRWSNVNSGRGVWFGMRSNTTGTSDHKIWQVSGSDVPWGRGAHIPIIINSGAGNMKDNAGTLNTSAITAVGFWVGGLGTQTCQMGFGSLWVMDKTTIAGGNSSEPMGIPDIVSIIANSKERVSAILQGAKQMLLLQDVQIGDGGTNPVYLDLDATAIEFPRQYNATTKEVNYNSTDNVIGIKYNPGASDTIKHRNSVISSRSRYFWGLHSSASASATYDFSGLQVIGAGTITLDKAISILELTISDYSTLDISGASLNNCTISSVPTANDSVTTSASTNIDNCTISVANVTAGNRWCSVADPSIFSGCSFIGGGGHAVRVTTPGTYSFVGNTFTGFGADGSTGAAIYNDSGGLVTLNISGGNTPTIRNGAGASTTINNTVSLTITCVDESNVPIQNVQVGIFNSSNLTQYMNELTDSGGVATETFNFISNTPIIIRARKSTAAPVYFPFETTGTITNLGFTLSIVLLADNVIT